MVVCYARRIWPKFFRDGADMLFRSHEDKASALKQSYDICISGTGPAGITLALKLAARKHRVLLLEAGDLHFDPRSNDVYKGTNSGQDYFACNVSRQRFFGGTSNHWGGMCHALEARDFAQRSYVPHSGWPIEKADLDPYRQETIGILDVKFLPAPDYLGVQHQDAHLQKLDFGYSDPPTRFKNKYLRAIEASENITALLNANVVDIVLTEDGGRIKALQVSDYEGNTLTARATCFSICHGGIENARTLLNANRQIATGIGNGADLVGRFFMEHPHFVVATAIINHENAKISPYTRAKPGSLPVAYYEPRRDFQDLRGILSFGARFIPTSGFYSNPDKYSFKRRLRRFVCESDALLSLSEAVDSDGHVNCPYDMVFRTAAEQKPNPASRVSLGEEVDQFGLRRVDVSWQLSEQDKNTLRQSALEVGRVMAQKDLGRVKLPEWLLDTSLSFPDTHHDEVAGFHHMGTTRMASSSKEGVVDENLRVFGVDNLYIGGSSVFPTSSHVNPTFTIVQLSLRLADHLDRRLHLG